MLNAAIGLVQRASTDDAVSCCRCLFLVDNESVFNDQKPSSVREVVDYKTRKFLVVDYYEAVSLFAIKTGSWRQLRTYAAGKNSLGGKRAEVGGGVLNGSEMRSWRIF